MKPLNGKAYGSIPHLPGSRMGPADHHCHDGQRVIACEKARDRHDRIIVTEKLDGSCVSIARINQQIVPLIRAGYTADSSPYEHLRQFGDWVQNNVPAFDDLNDGERIVGEWLGLAHGTIYELTHGPFVAFDLISNGKRLPHDAARELFGRMDLPSAHVVHDGGPVSVAEILGRLGQHGFHGATEEIEGAVWRVERRGQFDFIAKYVRPSKVDGKYLPNIANADPVWLWRAQ